MSGDCGNREERLVSLLYEDGDPIELEEIRAHLTTCAACREEFEKLSATRELLGAWPDVVNAPSVIYVNGPAGRTGRIGGGKGRVGWGGFGSFLPSLAAAAVVALLFVAAASVTRLRIDPDGWLSIGFRGASTADAAALVTRADLDRSLARTAAYLEASARAARQEDRRTLLGVVDQALQDQNASVGARVSSAIDSAFDEIDQRRRADLNVMLSSMNDLQVVTGTELQRMNAMLASLAPAPSAEQE